MSSTAGDPLLGLFAEPLVRALFGLLLLGGVFALAAWLADRRWRAQGR